MSLVAASTGVRLQLANFKRRSEGGAVRPFVFLLGFGLCLCCSGCGGGPRGEMPAAMVVPESQMAEHRPAEVLVDGYVGAESCRECHERNYESWHASYHRTMTQLPSESAIRADFSGRPVTIEGRTYVFERRGEQYWVTMPDPDAPLNPNAPDATRIERPIALVTGSHCLQMYWYPTGHSRTLGLVPVHYFIEEQKWLPTSATLLRPKTEMSSDTGRWNGRCIQCHATHGRTRPRADGGMDSEVAEFGISCEACHGAGESHVASQRRRTAQGGAGAEAGLAGGAGGERTDAVVNPARLSAKAASQICGLCHSYTIPLSDERERREMEAGFDFRPGGDLEKSLGLVRRDSRTEQHVARFKLNLEEYLAQRFWPDGMSRVAGREYNALAESACHLRGEMSCLSCHSMHRTAEDPRTLDEWADKQLKPGMDGDAACVQCHEASRYAIDSHTHHAAESDGSRCYNCHLPYTTYGLLRAMRGHQIEIPSVATTKQTGRPNACNLCHLDQTLAWSAERLRDWYGQSAPELMDIERTRAAGVMWGLAGDAGQRALAAWHMGWAPARSASKSDWMTPMLTELMQDDYEAVRTIAWKSMRSLPEALQVEYDVVGPANGRAAIVRDLRRAWESAKGARAATGARPEVLLDEGGGLDRLGFEELFRRRDRRPVVLLE